VNLINYSKKILTKIIFTVIILFELSLVEYLSVWTGVKTYSGWNSYLTIALYVVEMIICSILAKGIKKIP
jgi:hypothetical protein